VAALVLSATALGISAAVDTPRTLMSRGDYNVALNAIGDRIKAAYAGCRAEAAGGPRAVCRAQVRAQARIDAAELRAKYYGTVKAQEAAEKVREDARLEFERARKLAST
jgi:hypothetical protein